MNMKVVARWLWTLSVAYLVVACAGSRSPALPSDASILPTPTSHSIQSGLQITSPAPTPTPTSPSATAETLGYDLLFLRSTGANSYEFVRWDQQTGQSEVLVTEEVSYQYATGPVTETVSSDVQQYSVTADGRTAAIHLQTRHLKDTKIPFSPNLLLNELALLDLETAQIHTLAQFANRLTEMSIAPNGHWVAYILDQRESKEAAGPIKVQAIQIREPEQRHSLGDCVGWCGDLLWSPDGKEIVWSDERGIWLVELDGTPAQLIRQEMRVLGYNGRLAVFSPQAWAPNGEYLIVVPPPAANVAEWHVLEVQTGHITVVPNALFYPLQNVRLSWLRDGRLFVVRHGEAETEMLPTGEIWRVAHTGTDGEISLHLDRSFTLSASSNTYPTAPTQLQDGRLAFVLVAQNDTDLSASGLYVVDPHGDFPQHISEPLPIAPDPSAVDAEWVPNSLGAIFIYALRGESFFVPFDYRGIRPHFWGGACCFTWLEVPVTANTPQ